MSTLVKIRRVVLALPLLPLSLCAEGLPQPLSLAQALTLAPDTPAQALIAAKQAQAAAKLEQSQAALSTRLDLELTGRWVKATSDDPVYDGNSDHRAALTLSKPIYNRSLQQQRKAAAQQQQAAQLTQYEESAQIKLDIMQAYFQVLLADLSYQVNTEAIAIAYIRLDRAQTRQKLGQRSDLEVAELAHKYELIRQQQREAENEQRLSRERLALLLNYPGEPPADVLEPELTYLHQALPPLEQVIKHALKHNQQIQALQAELAAQHALIKSAKASSYPRLDASLSWLAWENQYGARDDARADLRLNVPLYTGGRRDSAVAAARAKQQQLQAELSQAQLQIREQVLSLWFKISAAQKQQAQFDSALDWRDLYLDNSRARYDLELQSDLGNALVEQTRVSLETERWRYQLALDWQQLAILLAQHTLPLQLEKAS